MMLPILLTILGMIGLAGPLLFPLGFAWFCDRILKIKSPFRAYIVGTACYVLGIAVFIWVMSQGFVRSLMTPVLSLFEDSEFILPMSLWFVVGWVISAFLWSLKDNPDSRVPEGR